MVKIKYNGNISPCRVFVDDMLFYIRDDEVKDLDEKHAKLLVENKYGGDIVPQPSVHCFKYVDKVTIAEVKGPEPEKDDIEHMNKDELLDFTAKEGIEADYTMTKKELRNKIRDSEN
jgi:hypothetical protein